VLRGERRYAEAADYFRRSIDVVDRVLAPDHAHRAYPRVGLAGVYAEQGEHARAVPLLRQALAIRRGALAPDHRETGLALSELGASLLALRRYAAADSMLAGALEISRADRGVEDPRTQLIVQQLVELHEARGDAGTALRYRAMLTEPAP
jgi:tetratricopeptide (TPR) repeat protein